jgi:glycosyltransferase involved in cell wall biosynthesis
MQSEAPQTVLFVESAAAMGGVQFSTLYLAQNLEPTRWKPIVVCPAEGDLTRECRNSGIECRVLDQPGLWSTSIRIGAGRLPNPAAWMWDAWLMGRSARRLSSYLDQCSPDLVITKGLSAHFFGGLAARKRGIPCVWHVQDFISPRSFGIYERAFGRAAAWLPNQIIVDGATIAEQLPQTLKPRVTVILNGVDTRIFRPGVDGAGVRREMGIPSDHLVVGHLARLTPWKGQHYLIEAFARIANENPRVSLLLVGSPVFDNDAYQRRLLTAVAHFGLDDRIRFAGYRHDTANVLAAMDVFAFTSIEKDTSPLALLSAMASGLAIVAFDIAGVRELLGCKDQFRLVPSEDIGALSEALSLVLNDASLRLQLGESARKQAELEFNLDKYTARIEQVFREALQSERSSSVKQPASDVTTSELRDCA